MVTMGKYLSFHKLRVDVLHFVVTPFYSSWEHVMARDCPISRAWQLLGDRFTWRLLYCCKTCWKCNASYSQTNVILINDHFPMLRHLPTVQHCIMCILKVLQVYISVIGLFPIDLGLNRQVMKLVLNINISWFLRLVNRHYTTVPMWLLQVGVSLRALWSYCDSSYCTCSSCRVPTKVLQLEVARALQ